MKLLSRVDDFNNEAYVFLSDALLNKIDEIPDVDPGDEHSRAVHHGTAQSAHLTDTQTSPFADRLTAVCRRALFPPKLPRRSALLHRLCRLSTEDRPTYRSPPLYHRYYLNTLILPTSLPIRLRSTTD
jgi:hypothetical protein